ncbi:kelch domain-containing protein 3 isoform X2 [Zophobas morio]|uniref:kelch domain-containing protein 3 isoform X2 n=1 Tax=Zophobas morio TaxID=2755281 RepID=UPI003083E1D5
MRWITHLDGGPKRVNHAAVAVGHKVYSFGGYCTGEDSKAYISMDVHVLNTSTFRWTKHPVSDLPYFENDDILPYKRYGHTAVVYEDKVYIWGGRNDRASDGVLFCFDTTWHCWTAPKTTGAIPLPRDGHTACLWKHYMIIFGGYEEETDSFADSVYALDLKKMVWSHFRTEGCTPSLRDFHTAVCINNRMYLFGGRGDSILLGQEFYCNMLWFLDLENCRWVKPEVTGEVPIGRRSHSAFVYNKKMYIFGGYNNLEEKHFNDMYEYDPQTSRWSVVHTVGDKPCERRRQACVLVGDRLFLFGGTSPQIPYLREPQEDKLIDHCDLYILDFKPTLRSLCILTVRKHKLDESVLPNTLRMDIMNMFTSNKITISRPNKSAG